MNKNALVDASLALMVGLAASGCKPTDAPVPPKRAEPPVSVRLVQARRGEIIRTVSLPAMIAANQQVTLYAKVTGYLKTIVVDRGDAVKAGDLLAEIEVPELIADQAKARVEFEIAELDFKRARDAQAKSPDLITAQSIDTAKAKVDGARANLERAETLLSFGKITAPFAGVVTRRFVDPGAFVPAATSASTTQSAALVSLADFRTVRVQVAVPEPEVPLIARNQPVNVTVEELPGRNFEGTVTRFAQVLDEGTKTMLTEIDLANPKGELRPGMYATARIGVEKHKEVLMLPVEAILFDKAGASAFTIADGKAKKVPAKIGFNDGAWVEMLEGVQPNDSLILIGKLSLNPGQSVTVSEKP